MILSIPVFMSLILDILSGIYHVPLPRKDEVSVNPGLKNDLESS